MTADAKAGLGCCCVGGMGAPGVSTLMRPEAELVMPVDPAMSSE